MGENYTLCCGVRVDIAWVSHPCGLSPTPHVHGSRVQKVVCNVRDNCTINDAASLSVILNDTPSTLRMIIVPYTFVFMSIM